MEIRVVDRLETKILSNVNPNPKLESLGRDRKLARVVLCVGVLLDLFKHDRRGVIRLLDNQTEDLSDVVPVLCRKCLILVRLRGVWCFGFWV